MTIKIQHKRSAVKGKAPLPADLEYGEIAVNYEATDPALYVKDSADAIRRIGELPLFTQAGAGAKPRSYDSKFKDFVSVKDFGAVGDGVADDTAAIQAAINGAAGASVYFPPGIYAITSTIALPTTTTLVGVGTSALYPNFSTDWQVSVPTWGLRASTIQRKTGNGAIFSGGDQGEIDGLVIRFSGNRGSTDTVFSGNPSHCRFTRCVVQNMTALMPDNRGGAYGGWLIQGCQFVGCTNVTIGTFLDNKIINNTFTSLSGYAFQVTNGGGLNLFSGNRFEWASNDSIKLETGSRNNVITGNLFDAHAGSAIVLFQTTQTNTITSNLFWRNGRSMVGDFTDCHIQLFASANQIINNNIFVQGGPDSGGGWQGPASVLGFDSCANGANRFMGNNTRNGCKTTYLFRDKFGTSVGTIIADVIDLPSGAAPGGASDDFLGAVGAISKVLSGQAKCNVYENRQINGYGGTSNLLFYGVDPSITFSNSSGSLALSNCLIDGISYGGCSYTVKDGNQYASAVPDPWRGQGNWEVGKRIYYATPSTHIGAVKTASGSPDTWKPFGAIA